MISTLKVAMIIQAFFVFYPLYYGWEGAAIRSGIFTVLILIIAFGYFVKGVIKGRLTIPRVWVMPFLCFLIFVYTIGGAVGLLHGYPLRAILSDFFPMIEFVSSLFIGLILIRTIDQAKQLVWLFVITVSFVAWIEVIIYLVCPQFYFHQVLIKGLTCKRIVDFTPPIALMLFLAIDIRRFHKTWIFYVLGVSIVISIFLSFLKSVWLASLIGIITTFILHPQKRSFIKRCVSLFGFIVILALVATLIFPLIGQSQTPIVLSNALSLTTGLIAQLFNPELKSYERVQYIHFTLEQWQESPIIGKGLGAGWWTSLGETRLAEQSTSQRWRTDIPSYPLFIVWKLGLLGLLILFITGIFIIKSLHYGLLALEDLYWRSFSAAMCGVYIYLLLVSSFAFLPFNHFPIPFYIGITSAIVFLLPRFQSSKRGNKSIFIGE